MSRLLFYLWNLWPPFLGAGIRIEKIDPDFKYVKVRLKKRPWNANMVGIHYGGSIFSMTDPFYMAMLIKNLGHDYQVMDKAAAIRFLKPGKSDLYAEFRLDETILSAIKSEVALSNKIDWTATVTVVDKGGLEVAKIERVIAIRRRPT